MYIYSNSIFSYSYSSRTKISEENKRDADNPNTDKAILIHIHIYLYPLILHKIIKRYIYKSNGTINSQSISEKVCVP